MNKTILTICALLLPFTLAADVNPTVRDIMLHAITPATNVIWGIGEPSTQEEWQPFEEAAVTVLLAGNALRDANDDSQWLSWIDQMTAAADEVLNAVRARDLDAVVDASNERLYPPCEACHAVFLIPAQ